MKSCYSTLHYRRLMSLVSTDWPRFVIDSVRDVDNDTPIIIWLVLFI